VGDAPENTATTAEMAAMIVMTIASVCVIVFRLVIDIDIPVSRAEERELRHLRKACRQ
jgi:hypothetical protein